MWLDGTALYVVFKLPVSYFHEFWNASHIPLLKVFSYSTLVLEPLIPLMFFLRRGSKLKYILLAAFIGLHVLSALTLNIPYANIACAATAILMFREEIMEYLRNGGNTTGRECVHGRGCGCWDTLATARVSAY